MYNESRSFLHYGKEVEAMFYASYHAYGRADGAGAEDKVHAQQDAKNQLPRHGAQAYTDMTNESNDRRSWAYHFNKINRNKNLFPPSVNAKNKWLRKWCHVRYEYAGRDERTVGICLYRLVTGEGKWTWCDLLEGNRDKERTLCEACSTVSQSITFHTKEECEDRRNVHALPVYRAVTPSATRIIENEQKMRPRKRGERERKTIACIEGCTTQAGRPRRFRTPEAARRHHEIEHPSSDRLLEDFAVIAASKTTKKPTKKQRTKDIDSESAKSTDEEDSETSDSEIEEGQYVVEAIVKHKANKAGVIEYCVKWVGYSRTTWEPAESFVGRSDVFDSYKSRHGLGPNVLEQPVRKNARTQAVSTRSTRSRINKVPSTSKKRCS